MNDLAYLGIEEAHEALLSSRFSARELVQFHLDRITELDKTLQLSLTICADKALAQADEVDKKIADGQSINLLEGIPYTVKDMFLTVGVRTTAASKILDNFVPPNSASVIEKLNSAGAILIAKVNQDEFAHGGSTENSGYFPTKNPWNQKHVPGGSSGGSAAAVAAGVGIFSLGTDTGGSIRQPASYCGVVGLKPTYGLVSRSGVVSMASSLDCIGPITRSSRDAALVLEIIAGRDELDSTTVEVEKYEYASNIAPELTNKKIGIIKQYLEGLDIENKAAFEKTVGRLEQAGALVETVDLAHITHSLACYYIVTPAEISSNLSRYDGVRYGTRDAGALNLEQTYANTREAGFGAEVKRRILIGTYVLSAGYYDAYYKKAMQVRTLIRDDFDNAFEKYDALIGPTTPAPAFELGQNTKDPVKMYLADIMTVAANLAGVAAISLPNGFVNELPVGFQIITAQKNEQELFNIAEAVQSSTDWHKKRPEL